MGNRVNIDETDLFVLGDIGGKVNASEGIQIEIGDTSITNNRNTNVYQYHP